MTSHDVYVTKRELQEALDQLRQELTSQTAKPNTKLQFLERFPIDPATVCTLRAEHFVNKGKGRPANNIKLHVWLIGDANKYGSVHPYEFRMKLVSEAQPSLQNSYYNAVLGGLSQDDMIGAMFRRKMNGSNKGERTHYDTVMVRYSDDESVRLLVPDPDSDRGCRVFQFDPKIKLGGDRQPNAPKEIWYWGDRRDGRS